MNILDPETPTLRSHGEAKAILRNSDSDVSGHFHAVRMALKRSLLTWHTTRSVDGVVKQLRMEGSDFSSFYSQHTTPAGLRDEFEMSLLMALALTNERTVTEKLKKRFSFKPKGNGYGYYVGYKQALLGLVLDDVKLIEAARPLLTEFNAAKAFYFPSDAVIFAALDGDLKKLKAQIKPISKKFDGYAKKCKALETDSIRLGSLDLHWFSPYPDWAFFAQAIRRGGRIDAEDTFWMPMTFLNSFEPRAF